MLNWLRARSRSRAKAKELYGAVVAAARSPSYYLDFGVPDTPEGRFEVLALLLFLLMERTKGIALQGQQVTQATIEAFVSDMDDSMREMGVGDLSVPKKVRLAAAVFYERAGDYRAALRSGDLSKLEARLNINVFGGSGGANAARLARRAAQVHEALAQAPDAAILSEQVRDMLTTREEAIGKKWQDLR